jgi:hypothetical protein
MALQFERCNSKGAVRKGATRKKDSYQGMPSGMPPQPRLEAGFSRWTVVELPASPEESR